MLWLRRYERISIENQHFCRNRVSLAQNLILTDIISCTVSKLSQIIVQIVEEKWPFCICELSLGGLRATNAVYLRLNGKHVVDFLLVMIELFCYVLWLRCYERI